MRSLAVALLLRCAAAVPSVPPPVSANALALQRTLTAAAAASAAVQPQPGNVTSLNLAPGTYVFSNTSLTVAGARNLAITAHGVTLVFYFGFGLQLISCANLSIRGLTIDADPPNYAQGVLTGWEDTSDGGGGGTSAVAVGTVALVSFDSAFLLPDTDAQPFSHPGGLAGAKVCAAAALLVVLFCFYDHARARTCCPAAAC